MYSSFRGRRVVIPALPTRHLARPRLLASLDDAVSHPVAVVAAGPASGKTALVSEWVRNRGMRTAWVSLEPEDNAEDVFWALVHEALNEAGVAAGVQVPKSSQSLVDEVFERLAAQATDSDSLTLVLDDAHILKNSRILHQIDALVRFPLPGLHLILCARSDPLLPLHRYRVADNLGEIRAADLAMTDEEVRALLALHGLDLDEATRKSLIQRTEGWVAALRLSMMRMESTDHPEEFVTRFSLDRGSAGEYLLEEVLAALDPPTRQLLIRTSTCQVVSGSLADAILNSEGSSRTLEQLRQSNSFVTSMSETEGWYRYHPLMREVLVHLLANEPPQPRRLVDARAAAWHQVSGNLVEATYHAIRAEDWTHAAALLCQGAFVELFLGTGERAIPNIRDFLTARPETAEPSDAHAVAVAQAAVAAALGDATRLAALVARIDSDAGRRDGAQGNSLQSCPDDYESLAGFARLVLATQSGDTTTASLVGERLISADPQGPFSGFALSQLGASALWLGEVLEAERQLGEASAIAVGLGMSAVELECHSLLALLHCSMGRLRRAEDHVASGQHTLRAHPTLRGRARTTHHVAAAELALAFGYLKSFGAEIRRAGMELNVGAEPALALTIAILKAKEMQARARYSEAHLLLRTCTSLTSAGAYNLVAVASALLDELAVELGETASPVALSPSRPNHHLAALTDVAAARADLAAGKLDDAERRIRRIVAASAPATALPVLVQAVLVGSEVAMKGGDERRAVEQATQAVDLAVGGGILLPFIEAGERLYPLIARHETLVEKWPVPISSPQVGTTSPLSVQAPGIVETLTDRELSILRWLTTMLSVSEIADELNVSVNTVKTHVAAVYRKLGVTRRREAVARGRELRLL